ncbi:MAG TPA: hypothetical protein VFL93_00330 [Longimicrobiaceae bacterium]|nr:hypothetical protein [Longimicrobiaceae bacterium]
MRAAEAWLRARTGSAPEALVREMVAALPPGDEPIPEALAAAALALYARISDSGGGREDALPLLAADALFTHAFEAQAGTDAGRLGEVAERWGAAGRLGEVAR